MNKALRKAIVAGNWKMNNDRKAARELIGELTPMVKDAACEVVLCVPYTNLETALSLCEGTNLHIGAENCHWAKSGAFTGEISAQMLAEMGVEYVIIGHSERRQYFGETDQTVNARIRAALDAGLKVILCVGEVLEQRELGVTEEVVSMRPRLHSAASASRSLPTSSSLTSRFGQSVPAKLQPLNRRRRSAPSSAVWLPSCTTKRLPMH